MNKNCPVHRTTIIRCALHSPDLGQPFKYPEHYLSTYRKFFRDTWSQKSRQNMAFWSLYKRFKRRIFLQKLTTFRFWSIEPPQNVTELLRSHRKIHLNLKNILNTYKAFQRRTENFFWATFKKLFFSKILFLNGKIAQTHTRRRIFEKKSFLKMSQEKFSLHLWNAE